MRKEILLLSIIIPVLLCAGCKEKLSPESVVEANRRVVEPSELDAWIAANLVKPYNVDVQYRWDKNVVGTSALVYPPQVDKVQEVLEAVVELGLELFTHPDLGLENFLKGRAPLRIVLYGGGNPDHNGVELLYNPATSSAEMSIYNVNEYDPKKPEQVYRLARSIYHQMARRLIELLPYDRDAFLKISAPRYTRGSTELIASPLGNTAALKEKLGLNGWANVRGLYTMLGFLSAEDDFAEIISATLVSSQQEIEDAAVRAATPEDADYPDPNPEVHQRYVKEAEQAHKELSAKKAFVDAYLRKEWHVDMLRLQLLSVRRMDIYLKNH